MEVRDSSSLSIIDNEKVGSGSERAQEIECKI